MSTVNSKKISEYEDSPCTLCLVKPTCTRNSKHGTICKEYLDFVLNEVKRCIDESENRLRNK